LTVESWGDGFFMGERIGVVVVFKARRPISMLVGHYFETRLPAGYYFEAGV